MRTIHVIIGLAFGDEGKGATTDYLTRETGAKAIIRYNGGPQAAHQVRTAEGLSHVFAQFGAGTLVDDTKTFLSRDMCIDPPALLREARVLREKGITDALDLIEIHEACVIVTPYHGIVNRMREIARGDARHGSCGRGVGQAMLEAAAGRAPVLRMGDCLDSRETNRLVNAIRAHTRGIAEGIMEDFAGETAHRDKLLSEFEYLLDIDEDALAAGYQEFARSTVPAGSGDAMPPGDLIFEGAQGVLLDRDHGFFPHVTPASCTAANVRDLAAEYLGHEPFRIRRYGILRAYGVRHGAGPFPAEAPDIAFPPDEFNGTHPWQGSLRTGRFDLVLARYALRVTEHAGGAMDELMLTNLDRLRGFPVLHVCTAYEFPGDEKTADEFFEWKRHEGRVMVQDIRIALDADKAHRLRLTEAMKQCRPIYREIGGNSDVHAGELSEREREYLSFIERELGVGISIVSIGPRAEDRIRLSRGD